MKVSGGEEVASLERVTKEVKFSGKSQVSSGKAQRKGRKQSIGRRGKCSVREK